MANEQTPDNSSNIPGANPGSCPQAVSGSGSPQLDEGLAGLKVGGRDVGTIHTWEMDSGSYAELWKLNAGVKPTDVQHNEVTLTQTNHLWNSELGLKMINAISNGEWGKIWWCLAKSSREDVPDNEPNRPGTLHKVVRNGESMVGYLFREELALRKRLDTYLFHEDYKAIDVDESLAIGAPVKSDWIDAVKQAGTTKMFRLSYTWLKSS